MKKLLAFLPFLFLFTSCSKIANGQMGFLGEVTSTTTTSLHSRLQPTIGTLLLSPTLWYETTAIDESTLMWDGAQYRLYYTAFQSNTLQTIGMATATSMSGPWTKTANPVIGRGYGGAPSTRNAQGGVCVKSGSTYYYFATDGYGNGSGQSQNVYLYSSSDGITWSDLGVIFDKTSLTGVSGFGNTGIVTNVDGSPTVTNGKYHAIAECYMTATGVWESYYVEAPALTGPWTFGQKLSSLQVAGHGTYGGFCIKYLNGTYHAFYHYGAGTGNLPTYLAYATSTDMLNWTVKEAPFMQIEQQPFTSTNQIADVWIEEINGVCEMTAEYNNNLNPINSALYRWHFNGTFAQLISNIP